MPVANSGCSWALYQHFIRLCNVTLPRFDGILTLLFEDILTPTVTIEQVMVEWCNVNRVSMWCNESTQADVW